MICHFEIKQNDWQGVKKYFHTDAAKKIPKAFQGQHLYVDLRHKFREKHVTDL